MPGLVGQWRGGPAAPCVAGGGGALGRSQQWSQQVTWVLIFFLSLLPLPLPWQDGRGLCQRAAPSAGCCPSRRKGFREVAWGTQPPRAPALGAQQGPPGTAPCFHFRSFSASCSERPVLKITLSSPLSPQSLDVWAMILLMYV